MRGRSRLLHGTVTLQQSGIRFKNMMSVQITQTKLIQFKQIKNNLINNKMCLMLNVNILDCFLICFPCNISHKPLFKKIKFALNTH